MKLVKPTDRQMDAAFAEHVAGWRREPAEKGQKRAKLGYLIKPGTREHGMGWIGQYCVLWRDGTVGGDLPKFCESMDAALPYLEKHTWRGCSYRSPTGEHESATVEVVDSKFGLISANAPTLPKAAVIALLRAHGVEVTQ